MTRDRIITLSCAITAFGALATAWTAQYGFGLFPCELCMYQRLPYLGIVALCGLSALPVVDTDARRLAVAIAALLFLTTAATGFYHVGVEQEWWQTNCAPTGMQTFSFDDIQAALSRPGEPACNEIAFEVLGISMAGYNMIAAMILAVLAGWSARTDRNWNAA